MSALSPYDLSYPELEELLTGWGEPPYRARQLWAWLWKRLATSYEGTCLASGNGVEDDCLEKSEG